MPYKFDIQYHPGIT